MWWMLWACVGSDPDSVGVEPVEAPAEVAVDPNNGPGGVFRMTHDHKVERIAGTGKEPEWELAFGPVVTDPSGSIGWDVMVREPGSYVVVPRAGRHELPLSFVSDSQLARLSWAHAPRDPWMEVPATLELVGELVEGVAQVHLDGTVSVAFAELQGWAHGEREWQGVLSGAQFDVPTRGSMNNGVMALTLWGTMLDRATLTEQLDAACTMEVRLAYPIAVEGGEALTLHRQLESGLITDMAKPIYELEDKVGDKRPSNGMHSGTTDGWTLKFGDKNLIIPRYDDFQFVHAHDVIDAQLEQGATKLPAKVGPAALVSTVPEDCAPTLRAVHADSVDRATLTWSKGDLHEDDLWMGSHRSPPRNASLDLERGSVTVPIDMLSPQVNSRVKGTAWLGEDAAGPAWLLIGEGEVFVPYRFANRPAIGVPLVMTQQLSDTPLDLQADVTLRLGDEDVSFQVHRDADGRIQASGNPAVTELVFPDGRSAEVTVVSPEGKLTTQLTSTLVDDGRLKLELVPSSPTKDAADWKRNAANNRCPTPTLSFSISGTDRALSWNGTWSFDGMEEALTHGGPGDGDLGFSPKDKTPRRGGVRIVTNPTPPELALKLPDDYKTDARWEDRPHPKGNDLSVPMSLWLLARDKAIPCTHKGRACELTRREWDTPKCP